MIDPRPFNYQYRKPRLNNPTFQSSNVYDSLYHLRFPSKNQFLFTRPQEPFYNEKFNNIKQTPKKNQPNPEQKQFNFTPSSEQNSRKLQKPQHKDQMQNPYSQPFSQRSQSLQRDLNNKFSNESQRYPQSQQNKGIHSHLSNYGQNLMKQSNIDRFSIFQKQQKGYNIINCYPKAMISSLRVFPKLTLQNKLIENGRYFK